MTADLRATDFFSVDAPNIHVTVQQPSRFRIDTTQGDSWVGIFAGDVMVKTEAGETKVTKGHTFHIAAENTNQVSIDMNAALDDFDQWADNRDQTIQQGYRDAIQYVANYAPDYSEYSYGHVRSFQLRTLGRRGWLRDCAGNHTACPIIGGHSFSVRWEFFRGDWLDVDQLRAMGLAPVSHRSLVFARGRRMDVATRPDARLESRAGSLVQRWQSSRGQSIGMGAGWRL